MRPADRTAMFVTALLLVLVLWVIVRSLRAEEATKETTKNAYCLEFNGTKSHVVIPKLRYDGAVHDAKWLKTNK